MYKVDDCPYFTVLSASFCLFISIQIFVALYHLTTFSLACLFVLKMIAFNKIIRPIIIFPRQPNDNISSCTTSEKKETKRKGKEKREKNS